MAGRLFVLILSLVLTCLMLVLGLVTGIQITIYTLAVLTGYLIFKGALLLIFLSFLGLVSGIKICSLQILPGHYVGIDVGYPFIAIITIMYFLLFIKSFSKSITLVKDPFQIPLLIILIAAIISLTYARNISISLVYLFAMLCGYFLYRWIIHFGNNNLHKVGLILLFVFTLFIILSVAKSFFIPEAVTSKLGSIFGGRFSFVFSGPNTVSGVIASILPFLVIFVKRTSSPMKLSWLIIMVLALYILYITSSRNGYLAAYSAIFISSILIVKKKNRLLVISAVLAVLIISVVLNPTIMKRLATISNYALDMSALARFILWKQAIAAFMTFPLTGIGIANFYYLPLSLDLSIAHSQLLNMLAETGILGGVGYVILLFYIFRHLGIEYKKNKQERNEKWLFTCALIASWVAFTMHNAFDGVWTAPHHLKAAMFFWLVLGLTTIVLNGGND